MEGILECLRSRYEECRRSGTDGKKLAQEVGDVYIFVLFHAMESTALIHLGQWRRLQRETIAALALAERNANRPAIALCRLTLAWLHVEAMDFHGARDLCESVDQAVLEENPFAFFFQRAVLAKAFVGLNEPQRARQQFDHVMQRLNSDGIMMDYTIYAQLHHCLCEYSLQVGDRTGADIGDKAVRVRRAGARSQSSGAGTRAAHPGCLAAGDLEEARAELACPLNSRKCRLAARRLAGLSGGGWRSGESLGEPAEAAAGTELASRTSYEPLPGISSLMTGCGRHCLPLDAAGGRGTGRRRFWRRVLQKSKNRTTPNISQKMIFSRLRHGNTP